MTLTTYDAAMAGVVVLGMIWGAWRGVTWQLASLASMVLGYVVSHQFSPQLAPHMPGDPVVARALAMMLLYAAVSGGIFLFAWAIRGVLRKIKFEAFDRHLGMLLGGMEGAMLGILATFFVVSLAPSTRDQIFSTPSGKLVANIMDAVGPVLPSEIRDDLAPFFAKAKTAVATGEKLLPVMLPDSDPDTSSSSSASDRTSNANDGAVKRR